MSEDMELSLTSSSPAGAPGHKCTLCGLTFSKKFNLRRHATEKFDQAGVLLSYAASSGGNIAGDHVAASCNMTHSAASIIENGLPDAQHLIDPRALHLQLRYHSEYCAPATPLHFPGSRDGPLKWRSNPSMSSTPVSRVRLSSHTRETPENLRCFHNASLGSPTKKVLRFSQSQPRRRVPGDTSGQATGGLGRWQNLGTLAANAERLQAQLNAAEPQFSENENSDTDVNMEHAEMTPAEVVPQDVGSTSQAETEDAAQAKVRRQIQALVTRKHGPLCLCVERSPPAFIMQTTKVHAKL